MSTRSESRNEPADDVGAGGVARSFREELDTKRYTVVDEHWAGGVPAQYGVAPRIRIGQSKWFNLLWLLPIGLVLALITVAVARGLRELPGVESFIADHPGMSELPAGSPVVSRPGWRGSTC